MSTNRPPVSPGKPAPPPELPPPWSFKKQLGWGCAALIIWILVFSAGILIDSMPYRKKLGWKATDSQGGQFSQLLQRIDALEKRLAVDEKEPEGKGEREPAVPSTQPKEIRDKEGALISGDSTQAEQAQRARKNTRESRNFPWESYFLATLTYIPINVALLTVLAAFLGGCSASPQFVRDIWVRLERNLDNGSGVIDDELITRYNYLNENPAFSAFRGLIVYLVIASGLFVFAGSDSFTSVPDQSDSLTRYIRYAGIFSVFGYLAGHDPSMFTSFLRQAGQRVHSSRADKSTQGTSS